jgi:hypothetical protein
MYQNLVTPVKQKLRGVPEEKPVKTTTVELIASEMYTVELGYNATKASEYFLSL